MKVMQAEATTKAFDGNYIPILFATGTTCIGMGVATIGYAIGGIPEAPVQRPPVYPRDWMFWAIWLVLYPTLGVAGYYLWSHRRLSRSRLAWRLLMLGFAANLTWVPVVHLSHSPVAAPAVMDAIAGALILPAFWAITRSNRPAYRWCIPILFWGPITGSLKIWQLLLNKSALGMSTWREVSWAIYVGAVVVVLQLFFLVRGLFLTKEIS